MPNGTYEVTTWAGDLIAGNGTNFDIEGTAFAGPRTSTGVVHEQYFPAIAVSDGQLNVRVTGGDGRVNGIRVQTPLAAPAGLAASDIDAVNETITLGWQPVTDATGYVVYRSAPGGDLAEIARITDAATTTFADDTVALGESYEYAVATVKGERVSRQSDRVAASVVDPDVAKPAAPTGIATAAIDRNSVTLSWADPGDAVQWKVFRTTREDIPFEQVGTTTEPTFTDTDVLTTRPYLYQVVALNAGGTSEASATHATAVATTLVRQAEYLDRSPVAVQTDDGVYVGWRLLGLDARDLAFDVYRDGEKITDEPITGATNLVDAEGTAESTYLVTAHQGDREIERHRRVRRVGGPVPRHPAEQARRRRAARRQDRHVLAGRRHGRRPRRRRRVRAGRSSGTRRSRRTTRSRATPARSTPKRSKFDGTRLWRIDLGVNIRAGAHYTQFQVFDFDGDGRAEVAIKTADGTVDGVGTVIGNAERRLPQLERLHPERARVPHRLRRADRRGDRHGRLQARPRRSVSAWGDAYGNRVDRFLAGRRVPRRRAPLARHEPRLLHAHRDRRVGPRRRRARRALDVRLRTWPARSTRARATTSSCPPTSTATDATRSCSAR